METSEEKIEKEWRRKYPSLADRTDPALRSPKPGEGPCTITEEQWAHFDKEGWVVLPKHQVFNSEGAQCYFPPLLPFCLFHCARCAFFRGFS